MTDNNHGLFKNTWPDRLAKLWLCYVAPGLIVGLTLLTIVTSLYHKDEVIEFTPTKPEPIKCYVVPDCWIGERPNEDLSE